LYVFVFAYRSGGGVGQGFGGRVLAE